VRVLRGGVVLGLLLVLGAVAAVLAPHLAGAASSPSGPAAPPRPSVAADAPLVTFVGGSWTAGVGATGRHGYAYLTAEQLGWRARVLGVGGSGYSVPGPHHSLFAQRTAAALEGTPDVIVVQGSLNERHSTPAALARAATDTLTDLRARAAPSTRILVVGASYNPGMPRATIDWINAAIGAAAARARVPFVDPAAQRWLDPGDRRLWSDTIHPDDRGHQLVADRLEPLLTALLASPAPGARPATVQG
jgi:lysophospholipase L1-like esterase